MSEHEPKTPPRRTEQHEALELFVGEWRAEGWSYGQPEQKTDDPKSVREKWTSTHTGRWHTGKFFLIQDECAMTGPNGPVPFDTISIMGVDPETGQYFARTYENHGFFRLYKVARNGRVWTFDGATERARIEFSQDATQQVITWEWLKDGLWLPLCDRVATKQG